jgi:hypothetical protein
MTPVSVNLRLPQHRVLLHHEFQSGHEIKPPVSTLSGGIVHGFAGVLKNLQHRFSDVVAVRLPVVATLQDCFAEDHRGAAHNRI